jgi:hypothetical protein
MSTGGIGLRSAAICSRGRTGQLGEPSSLVPRQTLHETIWKRSVCRIGSGNGTVAEAIETAAEATLRVSKSPPCPEAPQAYDVRR